MRRDDVDWDALEQDYCGNRHTLLELVEKYKVSRCTILRTADRRVWKRDLSKKIADRTKEIAPRELIPLPPDRKKNDRNVIEFAARAAVEVIREQQADLNALRAQYRRMFGDVQADLEPTPKQVMECACILEKLIKIENQVFSIPTEPVKAEPKDDPFRAVIDMYKDGAKWLTSKSETKSSDNGQKTP